MFPSYPEGPISSEREKQFVTSVRQALPALRKLDAALASMLDQLAFAPLSVINMALNLPVTRETNDPFIRALEDAENAWTQCQQVEAQALAPVRLVRSLRDKLQRYGDSVETWETATLVGLAELVGEFMLAVRAVGWGDRFERLKSERGPTWDAAFEIYRRCERGDFDGAANLMEQCEKLVKKATTINGKWLYGGVNVVLRNSIPNSIVDQPEPTEPLFSAPVNTSATGKADAGGAENDDAGYSPSCEEADDGGRVRAEPDEKSVGPTGQERLPKGETQAEWQLVREGDGYLVSAFGLTAHFRYLKGFEYLAKLIRVPGGTVAMVELVSGTSDRPSASSSASKQPILDAAAKQQFQKRLTELNAEIDSARDDNDQGAIDQLTLEKEELQEAMKSAVGLGGRDRDLNNATDRLRPRIAMALTRVYDALRKADPPMHQLARHFEASISAQGPTFNYKPETILPWRVEKSAQ
jgi:hypothetical protein